MVQDTTQKNLFDCFNQLVSEAVEHSLPSEDNSPKASVTDPATNDSTNVIMSNWFNNLNEEDLMDNLDIESLLFVCVLMNGSVVNEF